MNWKIIKIKLIIGVVLMSIAGIVGLVVALLPGPNLDHEIKQWDWGSYEIQCPPLQLRCGPSLTKGQCNDTWEAARRNEKDLGRTLYTKTPNINKPVITVHAQRPNSDDDLCKGPLLGALGRTYRHPVWINPITGFDVQVCFDLIATAQAWRNENMSRESRDAIRNTARLGNIGHIQHELLHPYLGDRADHAHPKVGAGLMAEQPRTNQIGAVVRGLFARIDAHCAPKPAYHKSGEAR